MPYKDVARHCYRGYLDLKWHLRALVKGQSKGDHLNFLKAKGSRFHVVEVNDYCMKIDLNDNVITPNLFLHGCWEPYESQLMTKLLRPGMTVVDVGAHAGYYSLLAARVVGPTGRVVSFEPSPDNFALLTENIKLNQLSQTIHAENAALAAAAGEADLFLSTHNTGDHRIYSTLRDDDEMFNAGAPRRSVRVPVVSLDDYLSRQDISQVDMIKIDVQGAEMGVLSGMKQTLLHSPHLLLFTEFWPHGLLRFGTEPQAVLSFLTDEVGLTLFHILPKERRVVPIEPASFALQTRDIDPTEQIDLLGCPSPSPGLLEALGL